MQSLKPKDKRYEISENNSRGSGIRVYPAGRKSFIYRYRYGSQSQGLLLGNYPEELSLAEAHERHAKAVRLLKQRKDPAVLKQMTVSEEKRAGTVAQLATEYLDYHAKNKKRSWEEDTRIINGDILPR